MNKVVPIFVILSTKADTNKSCKLLLGNDGVNNIYIASLHASSARFAIRSPLALKVGVTEYIIRCNVLNSYVFYIHHVSILLRRLTILQHLEIR